MIWICHHRFAGYIPPHLMIVCQIRNAPTAVTELFIPGWIVFFHIFPCQFYCLAVGLSRRSCGAAQGHTRWTGMKEDDTSIFTGSNYHINMTGRSTHNISCFIILYFRRFRKSSPSTTGIIACHVLCIQHITFLSIGFFQHIINTPSNIPGTIQAFG